MKTSFGSKRKPRKIAVDEEEDSSAKEESSSESATARTFPCSPSMHPADNGILADYMIRFTRCSVYSGTENLQEIIFTEKHKS